MASEEIRLTHVGAIKKILTMNSVSSFNMLDSCVNVLDNESYK